MLKKVVKYKDFNGNECEETLYFNLNKIELTKLQVSKEGGMENYIKEAVETGDNSSLVDMFEELILDSYGIKSEDGKRFIKSPQLREDFKYSPAFEAIYMEVIGNPEYANTFAKAITNQV